MPGKKITQLQAAAMYVKMTSGQELTELQKAYWRMQPGLVDIFEFAEITKTVDAQFYSRN